MGIKYKSGYKYQLSETVVFHFDSIATGEPCITPFIELSPSGRLLIGRGYSWDGPSGPAIDTRNFMRGSLVHDALYQLMRGGLMDAKLYRDKADRLLQTICIEDGMWRIRAWWVYASLKYFGAAAARPSGNRLTLEAP